MNHSKAAVPGKGGRRNLFLSPPCLLILAGSTPSFAGGSTWTGKQRLWPKKSGACAGLLWNTVLTASGFSALMTTTAGRWGAGKTPKVKFILKHRVFVVWRVSAGKTAPSEKLWRR